LRSWSVPLRRTPTGFLAGATRPFAMVRPAGACFFTAGGLGTFRIMRQKQVLGTQC
jgi:hypothetical protein